MTNKLIGKISVKFTSDEQYGQLFIPTEVYAGPRGCVIFSNAGTHLTFDFEHLEELIHDQQQR
jgi:hypothetical protein